MDSKPPAYTEHAQHSTPNPEQAPATHLLHLYKTGGMFNRDLIIYDSDKNTPLYSVLYTFANGFKGRRAGLSFPRSIISVESCISGRPAPVDFQCFLLLFPLISACHILIALSEGKPY